MYLNAHPGTQPSQLNGAYQGVVTALQNFGQTPSALQGAVQFGINQAFAQVGGAGAAGVVNYTTRPFSGSFVTSIYDL